MCLRTDGRLSHQCDCTAPHRLLHINCYNNVLASNEPRANQSADCDTPPPPPTIYCGVLLSPRLKNTNLNLVVSLNFIFLKRVLMQVASS